MLKGTIEENVSILRNLHGRYQLYGLTNWSAESFPYAYKKSMISLVFSMV